MTSKLILFVANTRTGTTAIESALEASNPGFISLGEIFNPHALNQSEAFFPWLSRTNVSADRFLVDKRSYAAAYLTYLTEEIEAEAIVADIKYHDLLMFMPSPSLFDFPPEIFNAITDIDGFIVHLRRHSKFDSAISESVAQARNIYHQKKGDRMPSMSKLGIKWTELSEQIRLRYIQEAIVTRQLGNSRAKAAEVWYEDIFYGDRLSALSKISQLAGRQINLNRFNHEKLGTVYSELIPDFEKLKDLYSTERWDTLW